MKHVFTAIAILLFAQPAFSQTLFFEDFENTINGQLPTGWTGTTLTTGIWKTGYNLDFFQADNNLGNTPPPHTRFAGLSMDTIWQQDARTDILTMPSIPVQSTITYLNLTLIMDLYYLAGFNISAKLEMSTNNGSSWTFVENLQAMIWQPYIVMLPPVINASSVKLRIVHTSPAGAGVGNLLLDNVELYVPPTDDAQLYTLSPANDTLHNFATSTQGVDIKAVVFNRGTNPITGLTFKYKVGNGPVQAHSVSSLNVVWGTSHTVTHSIPCTPPGIGAHQITAWVESTADADHTNDTARTIINGAAFMPAKKPVIEERGGTWCGWCIRGIVFNDSLESVHGDSASIISVHNNDPMTLPSYDAFVAQLHYLGIGIGGFPSIIVDRRFVIDATSTFDMYKIHRKFFGFGDIEITSATLSGTNLTVNTSFTPAVNMNGNYRLALVITEDSVHKDAPGYEQTNSYSYQLQNIPFHGYEFLPMEIPASQMYYNQVARKVVSEPAGTPGSLPMQMAHSNTYAHTFNAALDTGWDISQLKLIVMIIDGTDSFILNSNHKKLQSALGVAYIPKNTNEISIYPNPATDVLYISLPIDKASNVHVRLSDMYGRNVFSKDYGTLSAGNQSFTIPVKGLTPGIYNLQLESVNGTTSKLINIIN